jgi:DNA-binding CsgD family transcriptional regulator
MARSSPPLASIAALRPMVKAHGSSRAAQLGLFTRDQAITAIVLAERLAAGYGDNDPLVIGWREELRLLQIGSSGVTTALAVARSRCRGDHLVPAPDPAVQGAGEPANPPVNREILPGAALRELLSNSEIRVLRYLPANLTVPEISSELYLSVSTVKTHMRHLYAKLGTHRRAEAVERARTLGLLAPSAHRR